MKGYSNASLAFQMETAELPEKSGILKMRHQNQGGGQRGQVRTKSKNRELQDTRNSSESRGERQELGWPCLHPKAGSLQVEKGRATTTVETADSEDALCGLEGKQTLRGPYQQVVVQGRPSVLI